MAEDRGWGLFNTNRRAVLDGGRWSRCLLPPFGSGDLPPARDVPRGAGALAAAPDAPCPISTSDATTGLRFHPVEILISMGIKLAVVAALGPPAVAVPLFEVILNATALFNHANIDLPRPVDRVLRLFVRHARYCTAFTIPATRERPTRTNGFNLPWWDRLLGTYIAQPARGHDGMEIGIEQFRTRRDLWLDRMLIQPPARACEWPCARSAHHGEWSPPNDRKRVHARHPRETGFRSHIS